jgi:acetyl esterase/lipase
MKNLLFLALLVGLVACQKNVSDNVPSQPLAAQNLTDLSYGTDAAQKMDLYLPAGRSTDSTKLVIMVHGGAWSTGDKTDFTPFVTTLQQRIAGCAVANMNYRLATPLANHFPVQENDMKAAIDFLVQRSGDYHISNKIILLGASSGAHMALLQAYKNATPRVSAVVDFFGPADMTGIYNAAAPGSFNQLGIQLLMNGTPATNASLYQQSSPLNFVSAQSPPTILLHGDADTIVNISQSTALKAKLQSFGVANEMDIYHNYGHDLWPTPIMNDAFDKIEAFVKANVH